MPVELADTYNHLHRWMKGKGRIIAAATLKEILMRTKFCKEYIKGETTMGGDRRGLSKCYYNDYVSDLISWKILRKVDRSCFELLINKSCERRVRKDIL